MVNKQSKRPEYQENPYRVKGITERYITKPGRKLYTELMVDQETAEARPLYTGAEVKRTLHDGKSYAKVFADAGEIILSMKTSTQKLFIYMLLKLRVNWDTVFLNADDASLRCEFSVSTFFRAIDDLLELKVISKRKGSSQEYWINPNICFNGNRVKLFNFLKQSVLDEDAKPKYGRIQKPETPPA